MTLPAGKVLKADTLPPREAATLGRRAALASRSIVRKPVVDAALRATQLITRAEHAAQRILEEAAREASALRLSVELEARAEATASVAAHAVVLTAKEAQALDRQLDQCVQLAELLAERLLGRALGERPELVLELARQALKEVQGAHSLRLFAHPEDAKVLETCRVELEIPEVSLHIQTDLNLSRGDLSVETELGTIDARLKPQLSRLARILRESLSGAR